MEILDNFKKIKQIDSHNILKTVEFFPKQCQKAWQDVQQVEMPLDYQNINNIVINGMGGSGLGGHIIFSLFFDQLKVPLRIVHGYQLPAYVDEKTLVILVSYSGTTEEILATCEEAKKKKAKITGITCGGELKKFFEINNLPYYLINPIYNPSGQPRLGVGYQVLGLAGLLKQCRLLNLDDQLINETIHFLKEQNKKFSLDQKTGNNPVKKIAKELHGKTVVNISAEFLSANAHTLTNQLNESSKNFAVFFLIPELNHHLLEGLTFPKSLSQNLHFLFLESKLFYPRNQRRFQITKEIVQKNKIDMSFYQAKGKNKFSQVFEILLFGGYLNYYLALLNQVNPLEIPWVNYFKKRLSY